ncbi:hypothetical protein ACIBUY_03685 [Streptomyces sp. NPDC050085]|uniref:hypothetical protein n=1 Tax=Streptomyces sp. NPDC050085 TaxID=3365600 RepID=UPI0037957AE6
MMRAVILIESLKDPHAIEGVEGEEVSRYPLPLNGGTVQVVELDVPDDSVQAACWHLAQVLQPQRYFAQLQDAEQMYVVFPDAVALVRRGIAATEETAQKIGALFGIPTSQMRFLEMFETAHPDVQDAR